MHCGAQTISRIPSPKMHFTVFLDKTAEEWTVITFVATDEKGMPMGFFRYAVNVESNEGFLVSVIVNNKLRGKGCGKEMIQIEMLTE